MTADRQLQANIAPMLVPFLVAQVISRLLSQADDLTDAASSTTLWSNRVDNLSVPLIFGIED
jgi:hypothetical protein